MRVNGAAIVIGVVGLGVAGMVVIGTGKPAMSTFPIAAWLVTVCVVDLLSYDAE